MGIICNETKQLTKPGYQKTTNIVNVEINKNYTLPTKENDNNNDNNYRCENADEAPIVIDDTSGCDNYILAEIEIDGKLVNKDARIINSYEAFERSRGVKTFDKKKRNEIDIRKCKIFIEGKQIPFSYFYKFDNTGRFKIKYCFQSNLKSLYALFCKCNNIKTLNFSNFNTKDATSTEFMLYQCYLEELNLSNFNTENVTNMQYMFSFCGRLKELNLSSFNTNNVTDMKNMFFNCDQLTELNLSSFNTENVTDMKYMFFNCYQLTNLDLSNFKTQENTVVDYMFNYCKCLTKSLLICYDEKILKEASGLR